MQGISTMQNQKSNVSGQNRKASPKKFIPFVNNFCPRRSLEMSRYYNYFLENEWESTHRIETADLIFIPAAVSKAPR